MRVELHPLYDSVNDNNDVAIVWLSEQAPSDALRSEIYRDTDEVGQTFSLSGYGTLGTGLTGENENLEISRLVSYNKFDAQADTLKDELAF
jgi:hypothetical protein